MKNITTKVIMAVVMLSFTMTMSAQRYQSEYNVHGNKAMYNGQVIMEADAHSFQILGYGYAKDRNNVYLDGRVLRYVDPATFRLRGANEYGHNGNNGHNGPDHNYANNYSGRHVGYMVTAFDVYFDGRKVREAYANTFKDLGDGYGKDAFSVFFFGEKIKGAVGSSFKVVGLGYSKDAFNVYFYGEVVQGANAHTFKVDERGYAHDAFNYYYNGRKLDR